MKEKKREEKKQGSKKKIALVCYKYKKLGYMKHDYLVRIRNNGEKSYGKESKYLGLKPPTRFEFYICYSLC